MKKKFGDRLFGYKVTIDQNCIEDYWDGKEYGDWKQEYENYFQSVRRSVKEDYSPDVFAPWEFKSGDRCYVVWLEYSTGDSFGHSLRGCVETVGIFKEETVARELMSALAGSNPDRDSSNGYAFRCTTSDEQIFEYKFAPWAGYFEHLEAVHLELFVLP